MSDFQGVVANNMGMSYASKFMLMAQDESLGEERVKMAVEQINQAVKHLKNSVRLIEGFDERIPKESDDGGEVEVKVADLEMRHFTNGFFNSNSLEIVTDFDTYDIR